MATIKMVTKSVWEQTNGMSGCKYTVYYKNKEAWKADRKFVYTHKQNLPLTVLNYVLNANCETRSYTGKDLAQGFRSLKREYYTM